MATGLAAIADPAPAPHLPLSALVGLAVGGRTDRPRQRLHCQRRLYVADGAEGDRLHPNEHIHFHCCVIDALFYLMDGELRTSELPALSKADIAAIQTRVSRRVLRWFVRRGLLDPDDARAMREWHSDGGFSLDASVRIPGWDRAGLERLLRYCARPPFALDHLEAIDDDHLRYHLSKPQPNGTTELSLTPLEFIDRIAALVPPPRVHRHRYHGVLAPNSPLRPQVTALAEETTGETPSITDADETEGPDSLSRSPARYLWATLIARLFEIFPLTCPDCGAEMKIIAFVIETPSVRAILEHIGEPTSPPAISPARGPPAWGEDTPVEVDQDYDPLAQPEPEVEFDQRVQW